MMRGIGGPLLCIGDLLSDVGEESADVDDGVGSSSFSRSSSSLSSTTFIPNSNLDLQSSQLPQLFQVCVCVCDDFWCFYNLSIFVDVWLLFVNFLDDPYDNSLVFGRLTI